MFYRILLLCLLTAFNSAIANPPVARLKMKNIELLSDKPRSIERKWSKFILSEEHSKAAKVMGKDYKDDQKAKFIVEVDENNRIDIETMKLDKHTNNFDFNLKVVEFLRKNDFQFRISNLNEPSTMEFIYLAF